MRILHVNKFLHRKGGAEAYMQDLAALQADAGHDVEFWGMAHPANPPLSLAATFPAHIELEPPPPTIRDKARAAGRMVWSTSARRGMSEAIGAFRPDMVHLHNIYHQLSPAILRPLARHGIPAVMTLHDYKLACPSYQLLDHGSPCEACIGGGLSNAPRRRCKDDSLGASAVLAAELWIHRRLGAYEPVAQFICPSRFLAGKMAAAGVFPDRLVHVPHFVDVTDLEPKHEPGGPIVFAGRLAPEKGVDVLIRAAGLLGCDVVIAGDGPERRSLEHLAADVAPGRIRFCGSMTKLAVNDLFRSGRALVVPSRWYENQPMVVLEAFACGLPVVGSNLGGIPELIASGANGVLVEPNDPAALATALAPLLDDADHAMRLGRAARALVERHFPPERHLAAIESAYGAVTHQEAA